MATISYMGKGTVYLQVAGNPLIDIGNVSKLSLSVSEDKVEMLDYQNGGGGVAASISRIKAMTLDMTAYSFSAENLNVALRGTSSTANSSTAQIVAATTAVIKGGLVMLARLPNPALAMVVTNTGGGTTYTAGTDYIRTNAGFTVPDTSTIATGDVKVTYYPLADTTLQGLVESATSVRLLFSGLNEARSGKSVVVDCYRVQFSPTKSVDLIGDKFNELQLSGTLLKDETKTGEGDSMYLNIQIAD